MASDYYLELDGIKGESQDSKHKETIEIDSFSFGVSQPGTFASGGGGGAGKASFQDLHLTTQVNASSPKLFLACSTGSPIKKAVLYVRKAGEDQQDYYTVTLTDVICASYQSGGHSGSDALPTDQFSLNYAKIEFSYAPQKADGKLDSPIKTGYNLKERAKV